MSESTTEGQEARRHIIKRPRLTRLLDETSARIILLVAPAGYGKTTLAREWCETQQVAWYQAGPSAADVAALAVDIGRVVERMVPGAGNRVRRHLRGPDAAIHDVSTLATLLAEDLTIWPEDAWLVIDDYHFTLASSESDAFMGLVAERAPIRLLLTSRARPSWASARQSVYGHVLELHRSELAMTEAEVDRALPQAGPEDVLRLRSLAGGWPAVIGLAAMTSRTRPPHAAIAETLHAYFAQELFQATPSDVQRALVRLAAVPTITRSLAETALQTDPSRVLSEAARAGFLVSQEAATYELHPLLREFLLTKTTILGAAELQQVIGRVLTALINELRWDEAFTLIEESEAVEALPSLLRSALEDLLCKGRVATVRRWIRFANRFGLQDPLIDLAEAESALRSGDRGRGTFFARRAARAISTDDDKRFRALALAGLTSHAADDYEAAITYYESAQAAAATAAQLREALWGRYAAAHHLELKESEIILSELESVADDQTPDDFLRIANGKFRSACLTYTSLDDVLVCVADAYELVEIALNPHAICGLLGVYAQCLMLTGRYAAAHDIATEGKAAAERFALGFARPYFTTIQAFALFGLREFETTLSTIAVLRQEAEDLTDTHSVANARVAYARVVLAQGEPQAAINMTDDHWPRAPTPAMYGEYLAVHALAQACTGALAEAQASVDKARAFSRAVEMETTALAVETVIGLQRGNAGDAAARLLNHVAETRHIDAFVTAYRAYPALLAESASRAEFSDLLHETLSLAGDQVFAESLGVSLQGSVVSAHLPSSARGLSRREREVLGLLALGLPNRAIAQRLYISEATVKVHVRHIFEKLGVSSRTEAAIKFANRALYAAPST